MCAHAFDVDAEPVGVRHALSRLAREQARVQVAPDVRAVDGVHAIERPGVYHELRSDRHLFGGLEDQTHFAPEGSAQLAQDARRSQQHGHMAVVAACVHDARNMRRVGSVRFLGDGERVHVRTQRDTSAWRSLRVASIGRRPHDGGDDAVACHATPRHAQRIQFRAYRIGGPCLVAAELGMLVETPPHADDVRF